jgi:hypothetical protein
MVATMALTRFNSGVCFHTRPWFHKAVEVNLQCKPGKAGFSLSFRIKSKGDHAGICFCIGLWGLFFEFEFHDVRHWNWERDRWFSYGEEEALHLASLPEADVLDASY